MLQLLPVSNKFLPIPNSQSAYYHSQLCNPRHWLKWVLTSEESAENKKKTRTACTFCLHAERSTARTQDTPATTEERDSIF